MESTSEEILQIDRRNASIKIFSQVLINIETIVLKWAMLCSCWIVGKVLLAGPEIGSDELD